MPCHPARARELLRKGKAAVFKRYPFTIILKERKGGEAQLVQVKIDPGSKTTGVALVAEGKRGKRVVWAGEIEHRGLQVKSALESRRQLRRGRRARKTRYRQARFLNRTKPKGWLPPSLMSRVYNIQTWVRRLSTFAPVTSLSLELVRFDTQKLENPNISGIEYQQGTLQGYEVREYLLEKWGRQCAYCDAHGVPLQVEHIHPRVKHGSNRISNLTLACEGCNQAKGKEDIRVFLAHDPERLEHILKQAKMPLRDAAAVNATRWKVFEMLKAFNLPVETGTGGRTKYNRCAQDYPKAHWIDAACVGVSGEQVTLNPDLIPLRIRATGHGNRQMCGTDKYGFPTRHRTRKKRFYGFQTGDMVRAVITKGKYMGTHLGRIACRARPSFRLGSFDVHPKHLTLLHRQDGYGYD